MTMNRNQYLMIGLVIFFLGVQLRFVDTFVLNETSTRYLAKKSADAEPSSFRALPLSFVAQSPAPIPRKSITPPRWIGWALVSFGGVFVLHSLVLKKPE